jgi:hypothetical protein
MKHLAINLLTALVFFATAKAEAQTPYGPLNQPPVSPYLNLLRGGAPAGVNYYGIVRPQLQFYSSIGMLQQQQQGLAAAQSGLGDSAAVVISGHPILFDNLSHYYGGTGTATGPGGLTGLTNLQTLGAQGLRQRVQQTLPTQSLGRPPIGLPLGTGATGVGGTGNIR